MEKSTVLNHIKGISKGLPMFTLQLGSDIVSKRINNSFKLENTNIENNLNSNTI